MILSAILPALMLLVLAGCLLVLVELVRHDLPRWADAEELR